MAVTPLYVNKLAAKDTLSDDDLVIIGEGDDAKKMTIAQLKEELGINALNTNFEDITSKFNWGTSTNYKAYRIGKVVVFSAMCNAKSADAMNFATILDSDLQPIAFTPLEAYTGLGADFLNRVTAYVTGNTVTARSYDGYSSAAGKALQGSIIVNGTWIIN